ncbi:MAG: hypothetical protein QM765_29895 [Myxococcales bacterium]
MKRIAIVVAAVLLAFLALSVFAYLQVKAAFAVDPPLAGYTEASEPEALAIGKVLVDCFESRDPVQLNETFDLDAFARQVAEPFALSRRNREALVEGLRSGFNKATGGKGIGQIVLATPEDTEAKILRARLRGDKREVIARLRMSDGAMNYLGLIVMRDPSGKPRVVDWFNYLAGELGHVTMSNVAEALTPAKTAPLQRLAEQLVAPGGKKKGAAAKEAGPLLAEVGKALREGKHAEALKKWKELPEPIRMTRGALLLRLQMGQGLGESEYQDALKAIAERFPNDPSLALALVDRHMAVKDYAAVLADLDAVERAVGGDPYLAAMRAPSLSALGKHAEAKAGLAKAMEAEPTLVDLWWSAIAVALEQKDHGEVLRLLVEVESKFDLELGDLQDLPDYADFVRSKEYETFQARFE